MLSAGTIERLLIVGSIGNVYEDCGQPFSISSGHRVGLVFELFALEIV